MLNLEKNVLNAWENTSDKFQTTKQKQEYTFPSFSEQKTVKNEIEKQRHY